MAQDDQMMLDLEPDDFHQEVTQELVEKAINVLHLETYDLLIDFMEPKSEDECRVIREMLEIEQIKRDCCGE